MKRLPNPLRKRQDLFPAEHSIAVLIQLPEFLLSRGEITVYFGMDLLKLGKLRLWGAQLVVTLEKNAPKGSFGGEDVELSLLGLFLAAAELADSAFQVIGGEIVLISYLSCTVQGASQGQ